MPVVPAFGRLRQEYFMFPASLGCVVSLQTDWAAQGLSSKQPSKQQNYSHILYIHHSFSDIPEMPVPEGWIGGWMAELFLLCYLFILLGGLHDKELYQWFTAIYNGEKNVTLQMCRPGCYSRIMNSVHTQSRSPLRPGKMAKWGVSRGTIWCMLVFPSYFG